MTPYSRVLVEKLTGSQLVKKFLVFYVNRGFITEFINARFLSLSSDKDERNVSHITCVVCELKFYSFAVNRL
jgi:hypothetical protein